MCGIEDAVAPTRNQVMGVSMAADGADAKNEKGMAEVLTMRLVSTTEMVVIGTNKSMRVYLKRRRL